MRIKQVQIHQIGPFSDLWLDFPEKPEGMEAKAEIHILTGENGVGKSTVLQSMLYGLFSSKALTPKFRSSGGLGNVHVVFNNDSVFESVYGLSTGIMDGDTAWFTQYENALNNPHGGKFNIAFFAYSPYRKIDQVKLVGVREITEHPLKDAVNFDRSIDPNVFTQWITNNIAREALEKLQDSESAAHKARQTLSAFEKAFTSIIDQSVKFSLDTTIWTVNIEVKGQKLTFSDLPDGIISTLAWLGDLLMRMDRVKWENDIPIFERNFILFLDEIEVHLHPAWQRRILPVVQRLFPNAQIFISTHSPFVIGSVDGAWIHKLVKPNGDTLRESLTLSEDARSYRYWLEEIFDIKGEYGTVVEQGMKDFYAIRDRVLRRENGSTTEELLKSGRELADQSPELNQIIEMEIRQINRRLNLQLSL